MSRQAGGWQKWWPEVNNRWLPGRWADHRMRACWQHQIGSHDAMRNGVHMEAFVFQTIGLASRKIGQK